MILSEEKVKFSLAIMDRVYIIDGGRIVYNGKTEELRQDPTVLEKYLAV